MTTKRKFSSFIQSSNFIETESNNIRKIKKYFCNHKIFIKS